MAAPTKFEKTEYVQIETPTAPNPRLATSISSTATTITLTHGATIQSGAKPDDPWIFSIKNKDTKYTELCYVTVGNISADGKTLSNVVRGIARSGNDYTASQSGNASDHPQDSEVRGAVAPQIFNMMADALQGNLPSGGANWRIGRLTDEDITVYAANGDANSPFWRYVSATNQWVFSNDGVSSTPFGTGAGVTGGDGITVTAGDIDVDLTDTTIFKTARTGNESRATVTAAVDGRLDKTFMPTYVQDLIDSGTTVTEIDQALDGISANVTATNLNTLTGGGATTLHTHTASGSYAFGQTTRATGAGTGTQAITHGLGATPKLIKIFASRWLAANAGAGIVPVAFSHGVSTGTGGRSQSVSVNSGNGSGSIGGNTAQDASNIINLSVGGASSIATVSAVDGTTFTLNFTTHGTAANVQELSIQWETYA